MKHVARQMIGDWIDGYGTEHAYTLASVADMVDEVYDGDMRAMAERAQRPYHHCAPVSGRMTVFANVEYPRETPPDAIRIGDDVFVRYVSQPE